MQSKEIDKLLKIIESNKDHTLKGDSVVKFIKFYNIKSGRLKIAQIHLYALYTKWATTPINKEVFEDAMIQILPTVNTPAGIIYKINLSTLNISDEALESVKPKSKRPSRIPRRINQFVSTLKIEVGDNPIELEQFYLIYYKYSKQERQKATDRRKFFDVIKLKFEAKVTGPSQYYFLINKSLDQLTSTIKNRKREKNS